MGRGDVPCHVIDKVFDENQQIMDLIDELAAEKQQNKAQLQRILDRIYRNIARYGDASESKQSVEAYVYGGWRGLLNTIKAVLRLLGTDFVGARMYDTADEELADLYELCTEADDVLLGALRKIWICSGQTESFDWVFTEHRIDRPIRQLEAEIAVFLSLEGYKRRFSKRQKGERYYYTEPDDKENYKLYTGPKPRWHSEGTGLDPDWNWKLEGNAKPIMGGIRDKIDDWVYVFRRSWQFCLDAQQIAEGNLGNQQQELLNTILLRHRIPFHKNGFNQWSLCSHGSDCKGHHDCNDHSWAVRRDPEFTQFIEKEASRDNDEFLSLDQLGLGPVQRIRLDVAKDRARHERLKDGNLIYSEPFRDWHMVGGLGGLVDSMLHGRVLWKAWNEGPQEAGTHSDPPNGLLAGICSLRELQRW
ncbi:hypothetical protein FOC1_g10011877 [Fusarium oxysporum f. sp. cubense race 1]|uniref:Uncharacterized protein n=1 Tax=Fusarium oxysporum f. sp. cubense (strain race 1) TaxID=1229664 RepID=N4UL29_FUSC1|nr:hypothetical protein FOC1_g10011877 [Fusarium oxysporum f. sp. cubense race 1]